MDRQPTLTGERLRLRPLQADDWDALWAIAQDRALWAMHPMHDRWQEPVFRAFFADALARRGALAVIERASGQIIGSSRFQGHDPADGGSVEIGWTFIARDQWGTGANGELKRLMLTHAFASVARVRFRVGEGNLISRRALAKIGARLTERSDFAQTPDGPVRHLIYEIDRAGFTATQTGRDRARPVGWQ